MLGSPSQMAGVVHEGDVIAGKYRIEKILGMGGMGVVVAARHIPLDQRVAIKFLLPEALDNREAVGRFIRQARAAGRITSEHVAQVTDVGTLESGAPYMVMEYLEGEDLAGWLERRGALPIEQAAEFVIQACVAVADAHALGIVHRDLKPANLFCVRRSDGQLSIKVLDFGISKLTSLPPAGPDQGMTKTSAMMGSPVYMSPEQMRSTKGVDSRTDIWSLGVVLFELITGRAPFMSDSLPDLVLQIAQERPPPLPLFRPDAPDGLEAVILKCLEKEPSQRYWNVGELALALLPFAPKRAKSSVERISGIVKSAGMSANTLPADSSPQHGRAHMSSSTLPLVGPSGVGAARGRSAVIGAGVLGLFVVVVGATSYAFLHKRAPEHQDEPPTAAGQVAAMVASPPSMPPAPLASTTANDSPPPTTLVSSTPTEATSTSPPVRAPAARPHPTVTAATPVVHLARQPQLSSPPAATNRPVDCSLPFTIDFQGHRVPKPECL